MGHLVEKFFPRAACAAHTEVLEGPAEAGKFMALEVIDRNDGVGFRDRGSDAGGSTLFAAGNRHVDKIVSFQTVRNDDVAAGRVAGKAVLIAGADVIPGIMPFS